MKTLVLSALSTGLGLLLSQLATALPEGVVHLDVEKRALQPEYEGRLKRRGESTYEEAISNGQIGYFTTVRVGSPGQSMALHLDTGSADLWVPSKSASICNEGENLCKLGSFDHEKSNTYNITGKNKFRIVYYDRSYSKGDYFQDTLEIGGALLTDFPMGLGKDTTVPYGLAGIGYHHIVALARYHGETYDNLPVHMYKNGFINTVAYSLWLNDLDANAGSLLFGGIDTAKFTGPLKKVPIIKNDEGEYDFFTIPLTSVTGIKRAKGGDSSSSSSSSSSSRHHHMKPASKVVSIILDSGATLSFLPTDLAHAIWREAGAVWFREANAAMIPCSRGLSGDVFAFQFGGQGGPVIRVNIDELVIEPSEWPGGRPIVGAPGYVWEGERLCQFGVRNHTKPPYILGDTFLRSAYLVHDLVNHEIGLAQTVFNTTKSRIVPFKKYGGEIPYVEEN